jgi:uncharacterized protein (DUF1810 family)
MGLVVLGSGSGDESPRVDVHVGSTAGESFMDPPSPESLERFVDAQREDYAVALDEVRRGRKRSHWMWYVFPQLVGLGSSEMACRYGIQNASEAEAYLKHPLLGSRLREIVAAVLAVEGRSAHDIFGSPDDLKLRSCCTLFTSVSPSGSDFERVIAKYFGGNGDPVTLRLLGLSQPKSAEPRDAADSR